MRKVKSKETLGGNKWVSLVEHTYNDDTKYTVVHETRCNGMAVVILPFRVDDEKGLQYLVRNEMTPPWSVKELIPSSVTGGIDNITDNPLKTALKELKEECGYLATDYNVIDLGTCYGIKCCDTVYNVYAIDVTNVVTVPMSNPDTFEDEARNEWIGGSDSEKINNIKDPLWTMAYVRHAMFYMKQQNTQ